MERYQMPPQEKALLEGLRQPFAVYQFVDKRVVTLVLSDGFCSLFGYADREKAYYDMDHDMYRHTHPDDMARIANAAVRFATEGGKYEVIYRTRVCGSADYRVVHAFGEHVYTDTGVRLAHVWYSDEGPYLEEMADTGSKLSLAMSNALHENSLVQASQYDTLTGLPSMTYFFELAEAGKGTVRERGGRPSLLYMDFSGMKFFNSKHGFAAGDKLLQAFARVLADTFGSEHSCRIGSDHFAATAEESELEEKLDRLLRECREMNGGVNLPVHVGVYVGEAEPVHVSVSCDRAKLACTSLSGRYGSAVSYYSRDLSESMENRQYIVENLDKAIAERWIQVYQQPIVRAVNEQVCDVEALARWIDPERGVLSPGEFIPALEDAGLIYKLDLCVVDRVMESIRRQQADGLFIVPHSVNLSRSDFDACDMVEEIRRRVDEAGVSRDRINIELTESVIGSDMEFMKQQVERFQSLGFQVWMDDFGSGYSSVEVLQTIRFDLIKFDMSFMRRFNEGDGGKIILADLMRMAASLGMDTVCEGVETPEQVRFLQGIGCTKLQGFYYSKPVPYGSIQEKLEDKSLIRAEDPAETDYYESVGRVNLFDFGVVSGSEGDALQKVLETLPVAVLEVRDGRARYIRSNHAYRAFASRYFHVDLLEKLTDFGGFSIGYGSTFIAIIKQCCTDGSSAFFNETLPDGSVVHAFARRVSVNPVTGCAAVVVAVLSVTEPDERTTYADIARALAADYYNLFVIDADTNDYIEYRSQAGGEELSIERHGTDFFNSARQDCLTRIFEEDRESFLALFTRERVLRDLDSQGVFTTIYRLIDTGTPMYVNMKITRLPGGNRLILGISVVDAQVKQQEEQKELRRERVSLERIAALSPSYLVLYAVNPETGHYMQYNASKEYQHFGLSKQGEDFFGDTVRESPMVIAPEDLERHMRAFTKENILRTIREDGFFVLNYRLRWNGKNVPVSLRASLVKEGEGETLIIGLTNDEEEYKRQLEKAYKTASENVSIYTHVAHALARGCMSLYYVNVETEEYIEFHTDDEGGVLSEARRGGDFFQACKREVELFVQAEDRQEFLRVMNREYLTRALAENPVTEVTYRQFFDGVPRYVQTKISRMEDDRRFVVLAVSDIDELVRQRRAQERIQEERLIYARLHAITGNFIVVYVVDPATGRYREFSTTDYYDTLAQAKEGVGFFEQVRSVAAQFNHPEDLQRFLSAFTKENILREIGRSGIFTLVYRLMMDGRPVYVQMKAAMVEEKEGPRLIVGLNDIDSQVRQEEEAEKRLAKAQSQANIDALTGVKNRHSFLETEARMNRQIEARQQPPFAIVMLDVNDLKKTNDTLGHQAGDQLIKDACKIICNIFKHSPVFRVGGDEFAVIAQGEDYASIEELLEKVREHNRSAAPSGGVVIACGIGRFENDDRVAAVFNRADRKMYESKTALKFHRYGS